MKKKRYISAVVLFLLTLIFLHSVDAVLGKDAGVTITLNPNITQYVTNNYTTYNNTYIGGFVPHAPWLYNDTTDIFFNYSRLIFEFYNSSQVDTLLNAQDECSEITGCVVGALTSESDPKWSGNYTACTSSQKLYFTGTSLACANDIDAWNTSAEIWAVCNNGTFQTGTELWNTSAQIWAVCNNGTFQTGTELWNTTAQIWAVCNNGTFQTGSELWNTTAQIWAVCNNGTFALISEPLWQGNSTLVVYTADTSAWDKDASNDITASNIASQNVNSSNYWDNYDTPPSTWTDTHNVTYHNYWVLNGTNSSRYWGNFLVSNGACSNVCTDSAYNVSYLTTETEWRGNATAALTGNTTQQMYNACNNGTFAPISEPLWSGNKTAALTGNSTEEMQDAVGGAFDTTLNYTDASNKMGVNTTWANMLDRAWTGSLGMGNLTIPSDCGAGNFTYGLNTDGTWKCREDQIGEAGSSHNVSYHTHVYTDDTITTCTNVNACTITAEDVACGDSCISDAEMDNDMTINTTKPINTTSVIFVPQGQMICAYNASGSCVQWIKFNTSGVFIQG